MIYRKQTVENGQYFRFHEIESWRIYRFAIYPIDVISSSQFWVQFKEQ